MKLAIAAVVVAAAILPAMITVPEADACQPYSFACPITGEYVHTCGGTVCVPPIVLCVPGIVEHILPTLA